MDQTFKFRTEILGKLCADIEPILKINYSEKSTDSKKIIPLSIIDEKTEKFISFDNSNVVNRTQIKSMLDDLADAITLIVGDTNHFFANMPDVLMEILSKVQGLTNILGLTDKQQKEIIAQIMDIIFDHIKLDIKIGRVKIPQTLAKMIIKPIVMSIAMSILNWIEKIKIKAKTTSPLRIKTA